MEFLTIVKSVIADWRQRHPRSGCTPIKSNLTLSY